MYQLFHHTIPQPDQRSFPANFIYRRNTFSPLIPQHHDTKAKTLRLLPSYFPLDIMIQRLTFSPVPGTWGRNEKQPSHNENGYQRTIPFSQKAFGVTVVSAYNSAARPMILLCQFHLPKEYTLPHQSLNITMQRLTFSPVP